MNNVLLEKYQNLLAENQRLVEENNRLRSLLEDNNILYSPVDNAVVYQMNQDIAQLTMLNHVAPVDNKSSAEEKIKLYMSLFRGREDLYAKRWENKKKGISGYSPVCANEWKPGICHKPKGKCSACKNKSHLPLDLQVISEHLRGWKNFVAGIYPLCSDETCHFLAIDFDEREWQKDVTVLRELCLEFRIPIAVERSRSGNGAHAWFFFDNPISATQARCFGSALLTCAMSKRHELSFKSYDRLFPNQDTMPKGGYGNLIALPLQKTARSKGNSVFIDEQFRPYDDQWAFLASIRKLTEDEVARLTNMLCQGQELGVLKPEGDGSKPWEARRALSINNTDFPAEVEIVKANMIYIRKDGISPNALNQIKRLAAFKNPEFYKAQAMRLPTFNKPRIISCAEESVEYLGLPRGCEPDIISMLDGIGVRVSCTNETTIGRYIDVEFCGSLRDEQPLAVEKLLGYNNGILCGTTAFGKTVVAIKLIAVRKVNTLILVDKVSLVSQWKERLSEFLIINEELPDEAVAEGKKRGRKKKRSLIGQLGGGKNQLSGIIDIAIMQSVNRMGEVRDCVQDYGMIIVDECHHVSAFSFEKVLARARPKYVYGLTATPTRKDGHHPIIYMQCGPIRYRDDAKKQADKRPFEHYVIPRFTSLRIPIGEEEQDQSITDLYSEIVENELRNQMIVRDVLNCYGMGRNSLVLTERTAHVDLLAKELRIHIPDVIVATGGRSARESRETMDRIANASLDRPLTLVATGRYIGEGFDEPRLDTLFLAMPISWKGTLQQYAGRLHRLWQGKNEVLIYDYVDVHVRMLQRMYYKRLNGYAAIGYKAKGETNASEEIDFIYDKHSFLPVLTSDLSNSTKEIVIVSPFITMKRTSQILETLEAVIRSKVNVVIVTRRVEDIREKNRQGFLQAIELMKSAGARVISKPMIHQKYAVIDNRIVWYGSINLLSYGSAEESVMRLESPGIANELMRELQ